MGCCKQDGKDVPLYITYTFMLSVFVDLKNALHYSEEKKCDK